MPLHSDDLQYVEQLLFFGTIPSYALQNLFFTPGKLSILDYFSVVIHWSYFFVPYIVLLGIWLYKPRATFKLSNLLVILFLAGLVIYALLPATPPWLASSQQEAPMIYKILDFVGIQTIPETYDVIYQNIGDSNLVAALPSVHFAVTFILFLYSLGNSRLWITLTALYCLAMAWTLVYLGEHYVIDLALGALVSWGVWYGYRRFRDRVVAEPTDRIV
jgi:membrane-associated phospholipid phosphatase